MTTADPARDPIAIEKARQQYAELKKMFHDTADARAKRHQAKPLYERLGGRDAIRTVVTDIVELHFTEDSTKALTAGVDKQKMIGHVTDWICQATGGEAKYTGRDMVTAHAHLHMTEVHFMAAGEQIIRCLKQHGVADPEVQELLCVLLVHHDDVIKD